MKKLQLIRALRKDLLNLKTEDEKILMLAIIQMVDVSDSQTIIDIGYLLWQSLSK